jgi:hypothetical protein
MGETLDVFSSCASILVQTQIVSSLSFLFRVCVLWICKVEVLLCWWSTMPWGHLWDLRFSFMICPGERALVLSDHDDWCAFQPFWVFWSLWAFLGVLEKIEFLPMLGIKFHPVTSHYTKWGSSACSWICYFVCYFLNMDRETFITVLQIKGWRTAWVQLLLSTIEGCGTAVYTVDP